MQLNHKGKPADFCCNKPASLKIVKDNIKNQALIQTLWKFSGDDFMLLFILLPFYLHVIYLNYTHFLLTNSSKRSRLCSALFSSVFVSQGVPVATLTSWDTVIDDLKIFKQRKNKALLSWDAPKNPKISCCKRAWKSNGTMQFVNVLGHWK